jgi:hypothetical protein
MPPIAEARRAPRPESLPSDGGARYVKYTLPCGSGTAHASRSTHARASQTWGRAAPIAQPRRRGLRRAPARLPRRRGESGEPATRAFAAVLRGAGLPIQRLVALLTGSLGDSRLSFEQRERLTRQRPDLVRWVIDEYYSEL